MDISKLQAYELLEKRRISDVHADGYYLRHKKSGARIALLSNDDENKVFAIGFRTPPSDSTGVAHILEHSVLCGSRRFPAKDPFVELAKGSMNTFLNAMTYPDKTVYPVASCNDQDFQNLIHVYMDAVLYTNIYEKEEIFRQEGWHYELESPDGELTYNGVVYNEMKGAFSSPEDVLEREILSSLYPDTPYANESGGNPENIPELKYSDFLSFHSKYYHPSNSYIYLYGNLDMEEKLIWLDEEYLSKYDKMEIPSQIALQKPFEQTRTVTGAYSITREESPEDNTYLSYNKAVGQSWDVTLSGAFQVLEYVLLSAPGAPLKKALLDAGIGKDILGSYDNGIQQPMFSVIAKNANEDQRQAFIDTIEKVLGDIVAKGLDQKALEAAINYYEFRFREADYGTYSAGLMYGLDLYNTWLYDDARPFDAIEMLSVYRFLKEQVGTDYYENLIRTYLLDNPHGSVVTVCPRQGLTAQMEQKLKEELAAYKASLDEQEIAELIRQTRALKAYQQEPSTKEELESIPMLTREDLRREILPLENRVEQIGETAAIIHELYTNGIAYGQFLFDMKNVPADLLGYASILKSVLGYVDTAHYGYGDLSNEINGQTGGITASIDPVSDLSGKETKAPLPFRLFFHISAKALYEKQQVVFDMLEEILKSSRLEDTKRLYEIIAQQKSYMQMYLQSAGHGAALGRASSYFSPVAYVTDATAGVSYYELLKDLEGQFEEKKALLVSNLRTLMQLIFRKENLTVDYTGEAEGYQDFCAGVKQLKERLYAEPMPETEPFVFVPDRKNEGIRTASKVQYVAVAGNFLERGLPYTGALRVLRILMNYEYLWGQIRVVGGAYGCMNHYGKNGDSYLVSYRDPNLERTLQVYGDAVSYLERFDADEREMTKYIIGTLSDLDAPLTPALKGRRGMICYLSGQTEESLQKERDEILTASPETIRNLAKWIRAILEENCLCVIGSEEEIDRQRDVFGCVRTL